MSFLLWGISPLRVLRGCHPLGVWRIKLWGPLNIQCAEGGEKIFRQTQQKSARVVDPTRRFFVKSPQGGLTEKIPSILCTMNF
jgi:hypothetical protein